MKVFKFLTAVGLFIGGLRSSLILETAVYA